MALIYRRLFRVSMVHDYYDTGEGQIPLSIVVSSSTENLLRDKKALLRLVPDGVEVYASVRQSGSGYTTEIPFDSNLVFSFYLIPRTDFYLSTNAGGPEIAPEGIYYVGNKSNNRIAPSGDTPEILYLSKAINAYAGPPAGFSPGSLVRAGNTTYEAVRIPSAAPPSATNWQNLGNYHCLSSADLLPFESGKISWEGVPAGAVLELRDLSGDVLFTRSIDPQSSISSFKTDAGGIEEGVYEKFVNNALIQRIYFFPELLKTKILGVIAIHHQGNPDSIGPDDRVASAYRFIGDGTPGLPAGIIRDRHFTLRFKNRQTHWVYKFQTKQSISGNQLSSAGFDRIDDRTYMSVRPLPLRSSPDVINLGLNFTLPNPILKPYKLERNDSSQISKLISEIFVHV